MTRQNKSRQKKKDNERTHEPTSGTYPLVCCPHHSHLHSSSCYKSFPPKDPHLSLLLVPAHSAPLTRSGKKWTNDHSISPANAFHFFVTSISESVIFFAGRRRWYVPNYATGWMAAPSWPRRPQSCPKRNGDVDEASRLGSTGVPFGFQTELES